jgi:hypothetical protein
VSAVLELVAVPLEDLEADFAEALAELDLVAVGVLQASAMAAEGIGHREHFAQVAQRTAEIMEAAERMQVTLDLMRQHPEYL